MMEQPQREHEWLQGLVGTWDYEHVCVTGPDQPPMRHSGRAQGRSLGGLWLLMESEGEMPEGGTGHSIITLGFDPKKGRFVGTFIGSMMTHLWLYDGAMNPEENLLTLAAEGPSWNGQGLALYHDMIEIVGPDHWVLRSKMQMADGSWNEFLEGHHHRVK